jgi:hypothetical protein
MPGGVGLFWVGWGKGQGGIEVWHVSKKKFTYTHVYHYVSYAYYAYKKHDVLYARTNTRVVRLVASSDLLIEFLFFRKPVLVGIYILMHPLK